MADTYHPALGIPFLRLMPMSEIDKAWSRMDSSKNRMVISGVIRFQDQITLDELRAVLQQRLLSQPRFRQKVVSRRGQTHWLTDDDTQIEDHVVLSALPTPCSHTDLQSYIADALIEPLPSHRPLWLIEHIPELEEGGSAFILRVHHCYADGASLVYIFNTICDEFEGYKGREENIRESERESEKKGAVNQSNQSNQSKLSQAWLLLKEMVHLTFLPADPETALKQELSYNKMVCWDETFTVPDAKRAAAALECTINDVLVGCLAGALRNYFLHHAMEPTNIRAMVPFNLRPIEKLYMLGNHFGIVYVDLPLALETAAERVRAVHATTQRLKRSVQPFLSYLMLKLVGYGPKSLQALSSEFFAKKASLVMTNVPGPKELRNMAGHPIKQTMFWVPQSMGIGLGVSIFSYNQQVFLGISTDTQIVADPQHLITLFKEEIQSLLPD